MRSAFFISNILVWMCFFVCSICSGLEGGASAVALFENGHFPRIPVTLYGKEVHFIVDTGADLTILDLKYKTQLGATVETNTITTATSQAARFVAYHGPEFTVGGFELKPELAGCLDFSKLKAIAGEEFDGFLGMNAMKDHVVSFNSDEGKFSIGGSVPTDVKVRASPIRMIKVENPVRFQIVARLENSRELVLDVDSANVGFLSLSQRDWDMLFRGRHRKSHEMIMAGADGVITKTLLARLSDVAIGTNHYANIVATLLPNPDISSTIGYGFIRRHVATFDFPNRTMYLIPGKEFGKVQEVDMSGLHLIKVDSKIMVHSVDERSPASAAGMRAGDELVSWKGKPAASMNINALRDAFRTKDGDVVPIQINQDGKLRDIKLRLKRVI